MHRSLAAIVALLLLAATAVPAVAQDGGGSAPETPEEEDPCADPCVGPCEDAEDGALDESCLQAYCAGHDDGREQERGGGRNASEARGGTRGASGGAEDAEDEANETRQGRDGPSRGRSGAPCLEAYCDAYPDASGCRPQDTPSAGAACAGHNATARSACIATYCEEHGDASGCAPRGKDKRDEERPPEGLCDDGRCDAWKDGASGLRWIDFDTDGPGNLTGYRVGAVVVLEAVSFDTGSSELDLARGKQSLVASDRNTALTLHDNPTGLLRFKGSDGSLTLTFPPDVSIGAPEAGADATSYQVRYADGTKALLRAENGTWDGASLTITGFGAFHVPASDPRTAAPSVTQQPETGTPGDAGRSGDAPGKEVQERVHEAIQSGRLGAEVAIGRTPVGGPPGPAQAGSGPVAPIADAPGAVLAYDDVEVTVDPIPEQATPEAPVRIVVSANLSQGRTISLTLDPSLFPGTENVALDEALDLRYYDLHDDGTETEVVFRQAGSLEDALDATDDGGQPEYWVVRDQDGLHVLVSVPHWSAHAITLASAVEFLVQPSVAIGVVAGLGGAGIAALMMLWPRRREED